MYQRRNVVNLRYLKPLFFRSYLARSALLIAGISIFYLSVFQRRSFSTNISPIETETPWLLEAEDRSKFRTSSLAKAAQPPKIGAAQPDQAPRYQDEKNKKEKTVAYAVSITACTTNEATDPQLVDAAAILKHSIHLVHQHSHYDYEMVAFVHTNAESCSKTKLEGLGFKVKVLPTPIQLDDIRNPVLLKHVNSSGCCGVKEFLKLYSLTLTEYVAVIHLDLDSILLKPLDKYLDRLLKIDAKNDDKKWIQAMFTRDYAMVGPGTNLTRVGVQGGFWMVQPNHTSFVELQDIILDGANFWEGNGWGGKALGKSWYHGVAQVQGLLSYYYSFVRPDSAMELNRCYINVMADKPNTDICSNETMVEAFNNAMQPSATANHSIRDAGPSSHCQDCSQTPLSEVYSAHFTSCQKPWRCRSVEDSAICHQLHYKWHEIRVDLEQRWNKNTKRKIKPPKYTIDQINQYTDILTSFQSHCWGTEQYKPLKIPSDAINSAWS